jgi:hypothetical protein
MALPPGDPSAHLSLLESGALREGATDPVLAARHLAAGPSAIWVTDAADLDLLPAEAIRCCTSAFATDPAAAQWIERQVERSVAVLPLAARRPVPTTTAAPRRDGPITYVGAFRREWPDEAREQAEALLDAAGELADVVIHPRGEPDGLPSRFHGQLRSGGEEEALAGARLIIAFAGPAPAPAVPAVVFDALAAGIPVLMVPSIAARLVLPRLVDYASNRTWAKRRLASCLEEGPAQSKRAQDGRLAVAHAHTLAARAASIASSLGYAILPAETGDGFTPDR